MSRFVIWEVVNGQNYGIKDAEQEIGLLVGDGFTVVSMSLLPETDYANGKCVVLLVSPVHTVFSERKDWEVT